MLTDQMLDEIRGIREQFWNEAGGDSDTYYRQLREYTAKHPPAGHTIRHPKGVRAYFDELEAAEAASGKAPAVRAASPEAEGAFNGSNEILEEISRIRDELWAEADGEMGKFCDQLREFTAKNQPPGPVLRTPEEIRRFMSGESLRAESVREDEPPKYGE